MGQDISRYTYMKNKRNGRDGSTGQYGFRRRLSYYRSVGQRQRNDKKQLEEVRNSLKEDSISKHSSIGMSNIDQRIKLCYGNGYGVNIDSVEGEGTMVTVILPNKSKN